MDIPTAYIPTNYIDAGRLLGLFPVRNCIEAVAIGIPMALVFIILSPFNLTIKIVVCTAFIVPLCGFALMGVRDYSLLVFLRIYITWRKSKRILIYRGEQWIRRKRNAGV